MYVLYNIYVCTLFMYVRLVISQGFISKSLVWGERELTCVYAFTGQIILYECEYVWLC